MSTPIIICDDSGMARKQMARALPADWDVEVTFAADGEECLALLRDGKGDVVFLDLNMPVLDGYGVLEGIQQEDLPALVIVVSGDIQPEAFTRVKKLGALDFVRKPTSAETVIELLTKFGLYAPSAEEAPTPSEDQASSIQAAQAESGPLTLADCLQEVSNVAMGRAADLLARLLGVFVELPIPRVSTLEPSELRMALSVAQDDSTYSAVCQGFIGSGIAGEALLIFSDASFQDMAKLLHYDGVIDQSIHVELLMDMSSILFGAFIKGFGDQIDIHFSMGHPSVLGQHVKVTDLLEQKGDQWQKTLSIEINYAIEGHDVQCDLLVLFAEDAIDVLQNRLHFMME